MKNLYNTQYSIFRIMTIVFYFLMGLTMIGVSNIAPEYLNIVQMTMQIYVGLFLIYRFNPLSNQTKGFSELDRKIAYTAGIFVITTTSLAAYLKSFVIN